MTAVTVIETMETGSLCVVDTTLVTGMEMTEDCWTAGRKNRPVLLYYMGLIRTSEKKM